MVTSTLVTDHLVLTLRPCCTGMDQTPGGKDESAVVEAQRLGEEVDVERRVQLLISFTTQVVFGYVAQVWSRHCHVSFHVCTHPCHLNRKQARLFSCS